MTCKSSYLLLICKSMIFICLAVIFVNFYFMDVVQKFTERGTTLVFSQETILENEMKPPLKLVTGVGEAGRACVGC